MQRIEDIRGFFQNPKRPKQNEVPEESKRTKKMKRVMMLDSDDEDEKETEPATKKQLKETCSTSSRVLTKTGCAGALESEPRKIMLTTAEDFFGSTTVKQKKRPIDHSKKESAKPKKDSTNDDTSAKHTINRGKEIGTRSPTKKPTSPELDVINVHEDEDFKRDILAAANDPLVSLEQNATPIGLLSASKVAKKKSSVEKVGENKSPPTAAVISKSRANSDEKRSTSDLFPKTPIGKKDRKDDKTTSSPTKTPASLSKQNSKSSFWAYQNRQGPQKLGSKTLPRGPEDCLEGKSFVLTGILESFERDDIKAFIERHSGKVTTNVSSKTSYVVAGRDPGESKVTKAESLGTSILDEDGLLNLVRKFEVNEIKMGINEETSHQTETSRNKKQSDEEDKRDNKGKPVKSPNKSETHALKKQSSGEVKVMSKESIKNDTEYAPKNISPKKSNETLQAASTSANGTSLKSPVKTQTTAQCQPIQTKPVDSALWVDKYHARTMKQIIGQQGEKSNARKLHHWLQNWHACFTHKDYKGPANRENGLIFKAALLSGVAGIGKTTTATVVSKDLGFEMVCMNASDTRSQKMLNTVVAETLKSGTLTAIMSTDDLTASKADLKHVLIMDEVDGMAGNEDRGGMRELIALVGKSKIPVICICNDRQHTKVRSLANHCFDLKFHRPRVEQLKGAMMSMCFKEGLKILPNALEQMIIGANQDIRQIIHHLQAWFTTKKQLNYDEARNKAKSAKKDQKMGPFDACRTAFCVGEERRRLSMTDKLDLFFYDYSLMPLFMQENYLQTSMNLGNNKETLAALSKAADSFVAADLSSKLIRSSNNWSLLPKVGMYSCVIPGELCQGGMGQFVSFPQWLGQNSKRSKNDRCLQVRST